jgi:hypothetical protein
MKAYFIFLLALLSFTGVHAQQESPEPKIGELLIMGSYDGMEYDHVHFPKLNFVLKKGGIGNWTGLRGTKVVIKEKYQNNMGETIAVLEPADGRRFLKVIPTVTTSFDKALANGELKRL